MCPDICEKLFRLRIEFQNREHEKEDHDCTLDLVREFRLSYK